MKTQSLGYLPVRLASAIAAMMLSSQVASADSRGKDIDADGIPNPIDRDLDNDGILNGNDQNVDGGLCKRGPRKGKYVGDRLSNGSLAEKDIDDDGLGDDSPREKDIDGDGKPDDRDDDCDGDGKENRLDEDCDGDGKGRGRDDDDDGDGRDDDSDEDDDNDGIDDDDDVGEVEIGLKSSEDAPERSRVRVKISKMLSGEIEFEVDGRGLAEGTYDIVVDGKKLGTLEMVDDDGRTKGETEFTSTPDNEDELLLPFDPSGLPMEILQGGKVLFSGKAPAPIL